MYEVKFDTLKRKARDVYANMNAVACGPSPAMFMAMLVATASRPPVHPRVLADEWLDYGMRLIDQWDVRRVGKLVELFPGTVPQHCHGTPVCSYRDNKAGTGGDWYVVWGGAA
jgi:hypothetical protein